MEEENKESKFSESAENLKKETMETAKKVKESMKETNFKEETKATKGLIAKMWKKPLETIQEIANDHAGKYFKTAIILLIIWIIVVFINSTYFTIRLWGLKRVWDNLLDVLKLILAPALGVAVYSIIILIMNRKNKKPLSNIISTVIITQLPVIFASIVSLLTIISSNASTITKPFTSICAVISTVLAYFGFKSLLGDEKSSEFIKKYIVIQLIYFIAYIVISLLGIYI